MGGVSNVDIDGNNSLYINTLGAAISTFETLPSKHHTSRVTVGTHRRSPLARPYTARLGLTCDGDDLRVAPDRSRAGAGGGAMSLGDTIRPLLLFAQQCLPEAISRGGRGREGRRPLYSPVNILPGMNAGASTYAVPSPIKGSGTAWVLLGSWALSPARPTPIHPRHECRGLSALFGERLARFRCVSHALRAKKPTPERWGMTALSQR
jgi:hypothetical protein